MRTSTRNRRRGFTLIEGVVAVVVLSIAVPVSVAMLSDAATVRAASVQRERAGMLARLIIEEVVADAASSHETLGVTPLDNPGAYRSELATRLADLVEPFEEAGMSWSIEVARPVSATGIAAGDASRNIYLPVSAVVEFMDAREGTRSARVTVLVAGLHE